MLQSQYDSYTLHACHSHLSPVVVSKLEYRELELVDCVAGFGMSFGLTEADMVVYCAPL